MSDMIVFESKGRRMLLRWMGEDATRTRTSLSKQLGVSQPAVSCWLLGRSRPKPRYREQIEILTGGAVKGEEWLLSTERKAVRATRLFKATGTEG